MEKTKTYVEKIYKGLSYSEVLEQRDSMIIENDGNILGFRFNDKDSNKISNYSKWLYFGKRISLEQFNQSYDNLIPNMENYQYVCHTQADTFIPMEDGDMTFDEVVAQKEKTKVYKLK